MIIIFFLNILNWIKEPLKTIFLLNENDSSIFKLSFDINFFHIPCMFINILLLDFNNFENEYLIENINFQRFNKNNNIPIFEKILLNENNISNCGNCYNLSKNICCNNCNEIINLFKKNFLPLPSLNNLEQCITKKNYYKMLNESCRIYGSYFLNKIPGKILFKINYNKNINLSYKLNYFLIGYSSKLIFNPLKNLTIIQKKNNSFKSKFILNSIPYSKLNKLYFNNYNNYNYYKNNSNFTIKFNYNFFPFKINFIKNIPIFNLINKNLFILGGLYSFSLFIYLIFENYFNF